LQYPDYTSTSADEPYDEGLPIQFVIESRGAADIREYNSAEREILFPRGTVFFVIRIDGRTIYLREE
jgi:hypothetical protein